MSARPLSLFRVNELTVGSLCAGIGGIELGLELVGPFRTLWQAEIDPYARAVLERHWPDARRLEDIRDVTSNTVDRPDVLTAGFPCQPHSLAGQRLASRDERDLWGEVVRITGELRPRYLIAENVQGLLSSEDPAFDRPYKGGFFRRVLLDLAALGYAAEWHTYAAADLGAHHQRRRVFILAYPQGDGRDEGRGEPDRDDAATGGGWACLAERDGPGAAPAVADPDGEGLQECEQPAVRRAWRRYQGRAAEQRGALPGNPAGPGLPDWAGGPVGQPCPLSEFDDTGREVERDFHGVAHGISHRVDRLKRLGNAVVPQQASVVGLAILAAEQHRRRHGVMPDVVVSPLHLEQMAAFCRTVEGTIDDVSRLFV